MPKIIAPIPPGDENPFSDESRAASDSSESNLTVSRPGSAYGEPSTARGNHKVHFGSGEALDNLNNRYTFNLRSPGESPDPSEIPRSPPPVGRAPPAALTSPDTTLPEGIRAGPQTDADNVDVPVFEETFPPKPLPRSYCFGKDSELEMREKYDQSRVGKDQLSAKERAARLSRVGSFSAPNSTHASPALDPALDPIDPLNKYSVGAGQVQGGVPVDDIPLLNLGEDVGATNVSNKLKITVTREASDLVRQHTQRGIKPLQARACTRDTIEPRSGAVTPEGNQHEDYVRQPEQFRGGILSSLLKLYSPPHHERPHHNSHLRSHHGYSNSIASSIGSPTTPKWYDKSVNNSTASLGLLVASSSAPATPAAGTSGKNTPLISKSRPHSGVVGAIKNFSNRRLEDEIKITIHIAETLARQKYILKLCRALMLYGAPTHRLEEYMKTTSRVLEIDGQFLYIPGCMIVSFGDYSTHTSDMQIVRTSQGVDLGKLHDTHITYKEVVHDIIGVEEATQRLNEIMNRKPKHNPWVLVPVYGIASAVVGPFSFKARLIDMPILFLLGCILGFLQLIVAPSSELYSNVFEISAAILTSFFSRAFGSIRGGSLFCFSALAQSSIALILPGYIILCGSLELQSKNIVSGSVRMFYAIIYSLFLGFGITIGSTLYGLLDSNATSATTCENPLSWHWNFIFVPPFTWCLLTINQARWKQAPMMIAIAMAGYVVNLFSSRRFSSQPQLSNSLGAFTIGVLGNLYSRVGHGLAFAAMLPAIFVQVPSGLAAQGSLISGIRNADSLTNNTSASKSTQYGGSVVLDVGFSMIQVAIGISVGLFAAALVVYPFGKKRSGLFTF